MAQKTISLLSTKKYNLWLLLSFVKGGRASLNTHAKTRARHPARVSPSEATWLENEMLV
jgi:hypothetical protein